MLASTKLSVKYNFMLEWKRRNVLVYMCLHDIHWFIFSISVASERETSEWKSRGPIKTNKHSLTFIRVQIKTEPQSLGSLNCDSFHPIFIRLLIQPRVLLFIKKSSVNHVTENHSCHSCAICKFTDAVYQLSRGVFFSYTSNKKKKKKKP